MRNTKPSKNPWHRKIAIACLVASLIPLLNACATPQVVTKTEVQRVPEALLTECPIPQPPRDATYEDGLKLAEARGKAMKECNKRFSDIRQWSESSR